MPYYEFQWDDETIEHLDQHGVSPEEFEEVVSNPEEMKCRMTREDIPQELRQQMQRERALIAEELPDLNERHQRMVEAKAEDTFSGHLRRAIHGSGRLVREIAADAGVSSQVLCEFLEGSRTLRSDVLDRLAQAVHATITFEPGRPDRAALGKEAT